MQFAIIILILSFILLIAIVFGIYYFIKRLIKYHSELKYGKTKRQAELEKMNIHDL